MAPTRIAVVTFTSDLHAVAIQTRLREMPDIICDVVEADRIADEATITWSTDAHRYPPAIPTRDADVMNPVDYQAIWYRRSNHPQAAARDLADPSRIRVFALLGDRASELKPTASLAGGGS